jgi:hypothetical protein
MPEAKIEMGSYIDSRGGRQPKSLLRPMTPEEKSIAGAHIRNYNGDRVGE